MKQFGHYQVIAELGRGGMGVVLKAHEQSLNRYVAIKVLSQQLADDESVRERFIREARAVAALNHPNVVQVYFAGEHEGQPFFSMEFVQGQALSEYLKQHAPLAPREAAEILLQAAKGLAAAHDKGIIHRDIKPANLMMTNEGVIKLTDFGIAMAEDQGRKLTSTGEFVGTPGYLSPEVCIGAEVDARTDIFSLGIVYFEMLAGTPPFTNPSPLGLMREVVEAQIPDITRLNAEVDDLTRSILARMLKKRPEERFESCHPLIDALEEGLKAGRFSSTRPLPNRDATRIWSEETTDATRQARTDGNSPPPPPDVQAPLETVPASSPPPVTVATDSTPDRAQQKGKDRSRLLLWFAAAVLLFAIFSATAIGLFSHAFPAPVQQIVAWLKGNDVAFQQPPAKNTSQAANMVSDATNSRGKENATMPDPSTEPYTRMPVKEPVDLDEGRITTILKDERQTSKRYPMENADNGKRNMQRTDPVETARKASFERLRTGQPRASVLMAGEAVVLDALQQPLYELLQAQGFKLVDNSLLDGASPWIRNDHWDLKSLQKKALEEGVDVLVLASSRYLGQETLAYYGQTSELISSNVELKVVRVPDLALLLPGERFQVRYTTLNADYQVKEAFADVVDEVERRLAMALDHG